MAASRSLAIFMEEEVFRGNHRPPEHWFSPFSNAFSYLHPRWLYAKSIGDILIHLQKLKQKGVKLHRLRIHSHGYTWGIRMGADDIRCTDFNPMNSQLRDLLDTIGSLLCANAELRFDACGQAGNEILSWISRYLGERVVVRGFSGTGNPMTRGDLEFRGGRSA